MGGLTMRLEGKQLPSMPEALDSVPSTTGVKDDQ